MDDEAWRRRMEGILLCTICGKPISNPATIPLCLDVFCKECISSYVPIVAAFLSGHSRNKPMVERDGSAMLPCPTCDKTFHEKSPVESVCEARPGLFSSSTSRKTDVKEMDNEIKQSSSILSQCQKRFASKLAQLKQLEKKKIDHFTNLQKIVENQAKCLIEQIRSETQLLVSRINKIKKEFEGAIQTEINYYNFLNKNASDLKIGLDELLSGNKEHVRLNYMNCCQRASNINSCFTNLDIPEMLLKKYKVEVRSVSLKKFTVFEELSESFELDPVSTTSRNVEVPIVQANRKWTFRLQQDDNSSPIVDGLCFWPGNEAVLVTERKKGRLLAFYVQGLRPDKPYTVIETREKFSPRSLVRMDKGAIWCSNLSEKDYPNLALLDKWDEEIFIYDVHKKDFKSPFKRKFSLSSGLAYYSHTPSDGRFLITDEFHQSLEMFTIAGETIWKIGSKNSSMFTRPGSISVDYMRSRILVSDIQKLHFLDLDGRTIQSISTPPGQNRWDLKGTCMMEGGDILVAESSDNRVIRLDSRDGRYIGDVLTSKEVRGVMCVDVSADRHLALTQGDGAVTIFKL